MHTTTYIVGGIFLILVIMVIRTNLYIRSIIRIQEGDSPSISYSVDSFELEPFGTIQYVSEVWVRKASDLQIFKNWWPRSIWAGVFTGFLSFIMAVLLIEHYFDIYLLLVQGLKSGILIFIMIVVHLLCFPCLAIIFAMSVRCVLWGLAALRYEP